MNIQIYTILHYIHQHLRFFSLLNENIDKISVYYFFFF